jgi:hypothetical protein
VVCHINMIVYNIEWQYEESKTSKNLPNRTKWKIFATCHFFEKQISAKFSQAMTPSLRPNFQPHHSLAVGTTLLKNGRFEFNTTGEIPEEIARKSRISGVGPIFKLHNFNMGGVGEKLIGESGNANNGTNSANNASNANNADNTQATAEGGENKGEKNEGQAATGENKEGEHNLSGGGLRGGHIEKLLQTMTMCKGSSKHEAIPIAPKRLTERNSAVKRLKNSAVNNTAPPTSAIKHLQAPASIVWTRRQPSAVLSKDVIETSALTRKVVLPVKAAAAPSSSGIGIHSPHGSRMGTPSDDNHNANNANGSRRSGTSTPIMNGLLSGRYSPNLSSATRGLAGRGSPLMSSASNFRMIRSPVASTGWRGTLMSTRFGSRNSSRSATPADDTGFVVPRRQVSMGASVNGGAKSGSVKRVVVNDVPSVADSDEGGVKSRKNSKLQFVKAAPIVSPSETPLDQEECGGVRKSSSVNGNGNANSANGSGSNANNASSNTNNASTTRKSANKAKAATPTSSYTMRPPSNILRSLKVPTPTYRKIQGSQIVSSPMMYGSRVSIGAGRVVAATPSSILKHKLQTRETILNPKRTSKMTTFMLIGITILRCILYRY